MIPWWIALICLVAGEIMGMMTIIICMGSTDKAEQERRWAEEQGLLYKENKNAADAGTSTAALTSRKEYFL